MELFLACLVIVVVCACPLSAKNSIPSLVVPDGLGVNAYPIGDPEQEKMLDMIQEVGFKFIRTDMEWAAIEKKKGDYDFTEYDKLMKGLKKRGIRALLILCYNNELYEPLQSIRSEEGRQAFARYAAACARRFHGQGVIWELWNEPNISVFWKPEANVDEYMQLAKEVIPVIRAADPDAVIVAPATSEIPLAGVNSSYRNDWLGDCFKQGLLQLIDGVSVHPYRESPPETTASEYAQLKARIAQYCPDWPHLPILSTEWGYTGFRWGNEAEGERKHGQYLARQFLFNISQGIPVSLWFDWQDHGEAFEDDNRFGVVTFHSAPKAAFWQMQRLVGALKGYHFERRIPSSDADYLLLFRKGKRYTIAAWTTNEPHDIEVSSRLKISLTEDPQYVPVTQSYLHHDIELSERKGKE